MSMSEAAVRGLYLDLMTKVVTNTIYGDPNEAPWQEPTYSAALRDTGSDWPSEAHSMIGVQRMQNLRELCERAIADNVPGDFIETGVWRGGACIMMRAVLKAYGETSRKVYCADSFKGLPEPEAAVYPWDYADTHHTFETLAVSLSDVKRNFESYGLLDEQVVFVEGFFKDTLHDLPVERLAVLRLDGDMYASTMQALEALYHKVSDGGFIVVDDYGAIQSCRVAVEDFRSKHQITTPIEKVDWTGVWWRKS